MGCMAGDKRKKILMIVAVAVLAAGATTTTVMAVQSPAYHSDAKPVGGGAAKVNK